jgi:hypothetical protein
MFADPIEPALVPALKSVTCTCCPAVLPAKLDADPLPQLGAGGSVASCTQISKLPPLGGFAAPAGASTIGMSTTSASGSRCRARGRLLLFLTKMFNVSLPSRAAARTVSTADWPQRRPLNERL